jgi:O-antigen/teichoic acid export membrane protein
MNAMDRPRPARHHRRASTWPELGDAAAWNYVSLGVSGLAGIVILVLIGGLYGAAALGAFNLLFAVFLVGGQLGVLGIHASVVRHMAQLIHEPPSYRAVLRGALVAVFASSSVVAGVLWLGRDLLAELLGRPELAQGIGLVAVAIVLFAANKVLLSALNGLALFRSFATLTAARPLLLLVTFGVLRSVGADASSLVAILTITEATLFLLLIGRSVTLVTGASAAVTPWISLHLRFGTLGFASNLLQELNVRIDVLVLSAFVDDVSLGIYSLAAVVAEAFAQIPIVARTVLAPRLIQTITAGAVTELQELARFVRRRVRIGMCLLAAPLIALYPTMARWLTGDSTFSGGTVSFSLLVAGVLLAAGDVPVGNLLIQGGHPGKQSLLVGAAVAVNVIGNLLLIPWLGISGAALATALSNGLTVVLLRTAVGRHLQVRL